MSVTILSALITNTAPAAGASAAGAQTDGAGEGDSPNFANLLGDATGAQADGQQGGQFASHSGERTRDVAANLLLAQEVGKGTQGTHLHGALTSKDVAALKEALSKLGIGQKDAGADQPELQGDDQLKDKDSLDELADQLDQIDVSGADAPSLEDVVDSLPSVQQQDTPEARSELAGRILGFLQTALQKTTAIAAPAVGGVATTTPSIGKPLGTELADAALFRGAVEQTPDTQAAQEEGDGNDQQRDVGAIAALDALPPAGALPQWVQSIGRTQATDDAGGDVGEHIADALPKLQLPQGVAANAANAQQAQPQADANSSLLDKFAAIDKAATSTPANGKDAQALAAGEAEATTEKPAASKASFADVLQKVADSAQAISAPNIQTSSAATAATYDTRGAHVVAGHNLADQVQVAVKRASDDGLDRITIQLQPHDLGRVEVKLQVQHDGSTHVVFTADKQDTLTMLQRDVRHLESSLQDAGVKADAGTMEFNLRQQQQQQPHANAGGGQQNYAQQDAALDEETSATGAIGTTLAEASSIAAVQHYNHAVNYGLDVKV